jgi:hypothetical protein
MSTFILKFITEYSYLIPNNIFKFFSFNKNKFIKSKILFDTIQYKSDYKGDNLAIFFLPLLINISQISNDIQKLTSEKKVISIISILIFHEEGTSNEYTHSLLDSNKLYSLDNFNDWSTNVLFNLIEKLELYNSFKKISLIIKVKTITNI